MGTSVNMLPVYWPRPGLTRQYLIQWPFNTTGIPRYQHLSVFEIFRRKRLIHARRIFFMGKIEKPATALYTSGYPYVVVKIAIFLIALSI